MAKKILLITTKKLNPPEDGRAQTILKLCNIIQNSSFDLDILTFVEQKPIKDFNFIKIRNTKSNILQYIFGVLKREPFQVIIFNKYIHEIKNINCEYDVVITDMLRTSKIALMIKSKKYILDMDDVLSIRYKRQLSQKFYNLGKIEQYFPKIVIFALKPFAYFVLRLESYLMEKYELNMVGEFDNTVLVSSKDANYLRKISNYSDRIVNIPNYIEFEEKTKCEGKQYDLCFTGNFKVSHNYESAKFIINEIIPIIKRFIPKVNICFAGFNADLLSDELNQSGNIILENNVEDLSLILKKSKVFLSPILFGSGIKTKILESFYLQIPVVTNDIGGEGIPNIELCAFIGHDKTDLAQYCIDLLRNNIDAQNKITNAKKLMNTYFSYSEVNKKWLSLIEK